MSKAECTPTSNGFFDFANHSGRLTPTARSNVSDHLPADQPVDGQCPRAAHYNSHRHQKERQGVFDAAAFAGSLSQKETAAPMAKKQREGNKNCQAKRHRSDEETERHRNHRRELDHQSKNTYRHRDVILVPPIRHLSFWSLTPVPAECMLRAVHEKRQR